MHEPNLQLTLREMKKAILRTAALLPHQHEHISSLVGLPYSAGHVEAELRIRFDDSQRVLAHEAIRQLKQRGLFELTYNDPNQPENYIRISEKGRKALNDGLLDSLDRALIDLNPEFVELRDAAWSALNQQSPEAARQAAHSARELIDQLLRAAAPDEAIRDQPGYKPDDSSKTGITRRHRIQFVLAQRPISDPELSQGACDLLLASHRRLTAISHSRTQVPPEKVHEALSAMEGSLRSVLLGDDAAA